MAALQGGATTCTGQLNVFAHNLEANKTPKPNEYTYDSYEHPGKQNSRYSTSCPLAACHTCLNAQGEPTDGFWPTCSPNCAALFPNIERTTTTPNTQIRGGEPTGPTYSLSCNLRITVQGRLPVMSLMELMAAFANPRPQTWNPAY